MNYGNDSVNVIIVIIFGQWYHLYFSVEFFPLTLCSCSHSSYFITVMLIFISHRVILCVCVCVYVCVHVCRGVRVHVYKLGVVFVVVSFIYSGFVVIFKIELKLVVGGSIM